jgi:hypothetical protein
VGQRKDSTYLLVDEHGNEQNGDEENNAEDNNDTGLALGPVLALSELVEGVLGASGEGHADGGHCGCRFLREKKSQTGCWETMWCGIQDSWSSRCSKTVDGKSDAVSAIFWGKGLGMSPRPWSVSQNWALFRWAGRCADAT